VGSAAARLVVSRGEDEGRAARAIADRARGADVVYLGEQHDNPTHHSHQRAVVEALVARGGRPALAFEMLEEDQQADVDQALGRTLSARDLDERLRWRTRGWPDFGMYQPLFEIAAREKLPVIALDLDPAVSRRIAREGLASLGARAEGLASRLVADPAREDAIAGVIREGHCGLLPEARLPTMVEAWHARNVTMARRLAAALDRGLTVVVIVGRGHQAAGGLPAQLAALRPGTRQVVVDMIEAPADARPEAAVGAAAGDAIWLTPAVERGDPCAGLRREPR
jgi:uncharacterized iron-regulated protein